MIFQFVYWLCLAFVFNISIAFEALSSQLLIQPVEQNTPRAYVRAIQQDCSSLRQELIHPKVDPYDYVYIQTPNGQNLPVLKTQILNYQPEFELGMLNEYVAPSKARRLLGQDYENNPNYFANKFSGNFAENVFHCVLNYQYPGFCKYVQQLAGFDGFVLGMTDQLKSGSELHRRMLAYSGGKEAFAALKRLNKAKIKELEECEWQAKYQAVRQLLQERDFDQHGIGLLEHYKIADQFTYNGNNMQMAQLKQIAHFFNDAGDFRQEFGHVSEFQQIVEHAIGFGHMSNQANRSNNISLSQACLEIGQNIMALGKGLKNGLERNVTSLYHLVRYPVDTVEGIEYLVKKIGAGIGKLISTSLKIDVGRALENEELIRSAQQDIDAWIDCGRQLYEVAKKTWHDKSKLERYELVGNYAIDLLLLKGLPAAGELIAVQKLAEYKPQAFSKLGEVGREINQMIGLVCAKVPKYLRKSEQMVAAGDAGLAEINLIEELNFLRHDTQISNSTAKISEVAKIVEFEKKLITLQFEYGSEILHDAKQALRINE